ncbi:MAG: hypothetical protein ACRD1E_12020, partial [Terriglobales bacterium]
MTATAREYPAPLMRRWRRSGMLAAAGLACFGFVELLLAVWQRGPATPAITAAGATTLAALAVLGLVPDPPRRWSSPRRVAGKAAALAVLALAAAHWLGGAAAHVPMSGVAAFCFLLLWCSLFGKPRFPATAVTADMLVALLGYAMLLDYLIGAPAVAKPPSGVVAMHLGTAASVLVAAGAWMAVWPRNRPVAFFLEIGSAGAVLRRLLPITLIYPVLLVLLSTLRSRAQLTAARITEMVVVYGTVVFGAALFWLIARLLDRRDAIAQAAERELRASEQRYRLLFEENQQ